jgi:hypothetical protein
LGIRLRLRDVLLLTEPTVVLVECKYKGTPSTEQYERHQMMGEALARRLGRNFYFGMVVSAEQDPRFARIDAPYISWREIQAKLEQVEET